MTRPTAPALERRIRAALDTDPSLDAVDVRVDVGGDEVRLSGAVGSYAEKLVAVSLARRLAPDVRVTDAMRVRPYGDRWRMTDRQVADVVRRRLGMVLVGSGEVDVAVDHHVVTVTGRVPTSRERAQVRHVVETSPGVDFVENEIEIGAP